MGIFGHPLPIAIPNVFTPTNDLPNESFGTIDRHIALGELINNRINNFPRKQQTIVEIWRQQRMCKMPIRLQHGIFMFSEHGKHFCYKLLKPRKRTCSACCPQPSWERTPRIGRNICKHLLVEFIERNACGLRPPVVVGLWRWLAIVFIEVPTTRNWLVTIHQHRQPLALPAIKVFHFH